MAVVLAKKQMMKKIKKKDDRGPCGHSYCCGFLGRDQLIGESPFQHPLLYFTLNDN